MLPNRATHSPSPQPHRKTATSAPQSRVWSQPSCVTQGKTSELGSPAPSDSDRSREEVTLAHSAFASHSGSFPRARDARTATKAHFPSVCRQALGQRGKRAKEPPSSSCASSGALQLSDRGAPLPSWDNCWWLEAGRTGEFDWSPGPAEGTVTPQVACVSEKDHRAQQGLFLPPPARPKACLA